MRSRAGCQRSGGPLRLAHGPGPGPGLRTVRGGSAIRLSSDHVRGNFSAYSPRQPMFRSAWLSARHADQRKRAAIPVRRRCGAPLSARTCAYTAGCQSSPVILRARRARPCRCGTAGTQSCSGDDLPGLAGPRGRGHRHLHLELASAGAQPCCPIRSCRTRLGGQQLQVAGEQASILRRPGTW